MPAGTKPQRAHRQVANRLLPQTRDNCRLERVDDAFCGFFRRAMAGQKPGAPLFRGRRPFDSVCVCCSARVEAGSLRPGFGRLTVRRRGGTPSPGARPVSAVQKRRSGRWSAVVCHAAAGPEGDGTAIGIDMNAGQVAASDGRLFHAPDMRRLEARRRRYQRMVARRRRTRARLARTARRIAMARRDWHHQVSRRIAEGAHTVAIEELKVRNMTASARGAAEEPGWCVRRKAGLNRVVLDTGWAALRAMPEYKAGRLVAVDPRHASRTCVACGHADNAHANAAREIRRRGPALLHGEAAGPWNREHASKDGGKRQQLFLAGT